MSLSQEEEAVLEALQRSLLLLHDASQSAGCTDEQIAFAEARLGFRLPPLVRALYARMNVELLQVPAEWRGLLPLVPRRESELQEFGAPLCCLSWCSRLGLPAVLPDGVFLFSSIGCGDFLVLDCNDPRVRVLNFSEGIASGGADVPAFPPFQRMHQGDTLCCSDDFTVESSALLPWLQFVLAWGNHRRLTYQEWCARFPKATR